MEDRPQPPTWENSKQRKAELAAAFDASAARSTMSAKLPPLPGALEASFADVVRQRVERESYWFQKIEIMPGVKTPGWSDPLTEKLPFFGLPEDLSGKRVLDIGCAEGFFSFEAEARGAREVVAIDSFPDSIRRFNIVREARQSNATAFLMNVYDLDPVRLGTFDLVLFYGVFYHLKHPQLALEGIRKVCVGDLLFQTFVLEDPRVKDEPWAKYHPHGLMSGANNEHFDPTVFWLFNSMACVAMLDSLGFEDIETVSADPNPFVLRAKAAADNIGTGRPPNQVLAPWS
jgi:tRNA (mo5U34)-methyltransferase